MVVTGASGNVGTGVLRALRREMPDALVSGVCRRPPRRSAAHDAVAWRAIDLADPDAADRLSAVMRGADVVVHLALAVQPVRDENYLYRANVLGTKAVLRAMAEADVRHLVYASSLGIYAPGESPEPVAEDWPTTGQSTSIYSRHKVLVEHVLDEFGARHPEVVIGRFRPTVVVQREAAWLLKSLYLGPFVPRIALEALRRRLLPVLPLPAGLRLQFVHADDVGGAVVEMIRRRVNGSYNIASDVLDVDAVAGLVGARAIEVDRDLFRRAVTAIIATRLVALTPGWYDVATATPVMDTSKARRELAWSATRTSAECAAELIAGMADDAVGPSAAMGAGAGRSRPRRVVDAVHDASLVLWSALAVGRAAGRRRAGALDAIAVLTNLGAGTPMALDRLLDRRRDPVAVAAPVVVVGAVAGTVRGGWFPVAATSMLQVLNVIERRRRQLEELGDDRVSSSKGAHR